MDLTLRASSLPGFADCERRASAQLWPALWREKGHQLRDLVRGVGAAIGTAVHRGASYTLEAAVRGAEPPPEPEAVEVAAESYEATARDHELGYDKLSATKAAGLDQVARLTSVWHLHRARHLRPILVEKAMLARATPRLMLSGHCDLYGQDGKLRALTDTKTGGRLPYADPQVGGYSLLVRSLGHLVDKGGIDFVRRVPLSREQPPPVMVEVNIAAAEQVASRIIARAADSLEEFVRTGNPAAWIPNGSSVLCREKYCPLWGTASCHGWKQT